VTGGGGLVLVFTCLEGGQGLDRTESNKPEKIIFKKEAKQQQKIQD
jgi:hypothetical protein